ncbi:MAG: hypothetical protein ACK4GO_09315 [Gemmobacter sp.]
MRRGVAALVMGVVMAGQALGGSPARVAAPGVYCQDTPPGLCARFVARVARVWPGAAMGPEAAADLRLVVIRAQPRRFMARIEWRTHAGDWQAGPELGAARAGGALDAAALDAFLDALIAQSPRP